MSTSTSQQYFKTLFPHLNLDWKLIYLLPRVLTKNNSLRAFRFKVLNKVLYLNYKLVQFRVSTTTLGLYCNQHNETVQHHFSTTKLFHYGQIAILGYTNTDGRCFITQNLILLTFKFYVYKSRVSGNLNFGAFCFNF